jgi:cytidyltransferase-like protein
MDYKRVVGAVFAMNLNGEKATIGSLAKRLEIDTDEVKQNVGKLTNRELAKIVDGGVLLTPKGRSTIKVVFVGGGFEVIHFGHVYTLHKAKSLGDVLVVTVARDSTIRRRKNRDPVTGEQERVRLLSALKDVDAAILGVEGDIYITLEKVRPDIVALGYDQYHLEEDIERESKRMGMKVEVIRLDSPYPRLKTSEILKGL